jgi:hypothetical protein
MRPPLLAIDLPPVFDPYLRFPDWYSDDGHHRRRWWSFLSVVMPIAGSRRWRRRRGHGAGRPARPGSPRRRWISLGLLATLVLLHFPLPTQLPWRVAACGLSVEVPFPCQHSACGCRTAQQCYASCCCHTPAQRRAFARRHDVDLDSLGVEVPPERPEPIASGSCCASASRRDCSPADPVGRTSEVEPAGAEVVAEDDPPVGLLVWQAVLRCQGIEAWMQLMQTGGWLPDAQLMRLPWNCEGRVVLANAEAFSLDDPPEPPPPRA